MRNVLLFIRLILFVFLVNGSFTSANHHRIVDIFLLLMGHLSKASATHVKMFRTRWTFNDIPFLEIHINKIFLFTYITSYFHILKTNCNGKNYIQRHLLTGLCQMPLPLVRVHIYERFSSLKASTLHLEYINVKCTLSNGSLISVANTFVFMFIAYYSYVPFRVCSKDAAQTRN